MPSTLGNNLVDSLVGVIDSLRSSLNPAMGVRQYNVAIVKRRWIGTKAELDLADAGLGALDTVVRAATAGSDGNSITVSLVADSVDGVTIEEDGTDVTIHVEDSVSTVADVEAAITADATLIEVKTAGTGATVLDSDDEFSAASLASGENGTIGDGSTEFVTQTTLDPQPHVSWDARDYRLDPNAGCGLVDAGYCTLREVSLTLTEDELLGSPIASGDEVYYRISDAQGQSIETTYWVVTGTPEPDREKDIGWIVKLRRYEVSE